MEKPQTCQLCHYDNVIGNRCFEIKTSICCLVYILFTKSRCQVNFVIKLVTVFTVIVFFFYCYINIIARLTIISINKLN